MAVGKTYLTYGIFEVEKRAFFMAPCHSPEELRIKELEKGESAVDVSYASSIKDMLKEGRVCDGADFGGCFCGSNTPMPPTAALTDFVSPAFALRVVAGRSLNEDLTITRQTRDVTVAVTANSAKVKQVFNLKDFRMKDLIYRETMNANRFTLDAEKDVRRAVWSVQIKGNKGVFSKKFLYDRAVSPVAPKGLDLVARTNFFERERSRDIEAMLKAWNEILQCGPTIPSFEGVVSESAQKEKINALVGKIAVDFPQHRFAISVLYQAGGLNVVAAMISGSLVGAGVMYNQENGSDKHSYVYSIGKNGFEVEVKLVWIRQAMTEDNALINIEATFRIVWNRPDLLGLTSLTVKGGAKNSKAAAAVKSIFSQFLSWSPLTLDGILDERARSVSLCADPKVALVALENLKLVQKKNKFVSKKKKSTAVAACDELDSAVMEEGKEYLVWGRWKSENTFHVFPCGVKTLDAKLLSSLSLYCDVPTAPPSPVVALD